jgi:hypothetical protein
MMQPILDYRAEEGLKALTAQLEAADTETVFDVALSIFGVDLEEPYVASEEEGGGTFDLEFDREDALAMIEGRMMDMFSRIGLAKFSYVDYEWARKEGLVP